MHVGISHLVTLVVSFIVLLGGAFVAGQKWSANSRGETAAANSAFEAGEADGAAASSSEDVPVPTDTPRYKVLRVVDGDTIVIEVNGARESVRMIGVDTPELNDSRTGVQCFAEEAAEKTKALVIGKHILLEKDPSQGERDKYKRLLGYVFLENGVLVNKALIDDGFAHEYTYDGAYKYQASFKAAEVSARESGVGLWAPDACPTKQSTSAASKTPTSGAQTASAAAAQPVQSKVVQPEAAPSQPTTTTVREPQPEPIVEREEVPEPAPAQKTSSEPSDSGEIVCSRNAYNCTDFNTQEEAQKVYDQCGGVESDIHKLDKNKDGSACDSLP